MNKAALFIFACMNPWRWLVSYFDFNKRERNGMLALLGLLFIAITLLYTLHYLIPSPKADFTLIQREANAFRADSAESEPEAVTNTFFYFDPNTASEADLKKLGLNAQVVATLMNYRSRGGHFYKSEDIKKIYGITNEQASELIPYIKIASDKSHISGIDINTADSSTLLQVSGIGPAFASRILHLRRALGAFISKEQLKDVYGIDAQKFAAIAPQTILSRQRINHWNINTASLDELRANPYLNWKKANAIIQYRNNNGNFQKADDLKRIYAIDDSTYRKLAPYISVHQ